MQVVIQKIPENLQEFETLAAKGRQPEHICALFLCALALFDRDKDAGTAKEYHGVAQQRDDGGVNKADIRQSGR